MMTTKMTVRCTRKSTRPMHARGLLALLPAVAILLLATVTAAAVAEKSKAAKSGPRPAVVRVRAAENGGASYGSGTLVAIDEKRGLVLTNWHVVRDAAGQVSVRFPDGFRSAATVLKVDQTWDLAALLIWRPDVDPIEIADKTPGMGDKLTIAGYGSGNYREASGKMVQYVSPGDNHPFEIVELIAAARSGDSGGPIFNEKGQMAGVLFGSARGRTNGSHSDRVRWFLKRAMTNVSDMAEALALQKPAKVAAPVAEEGI